MTHGTGKARNGAKERTALRINLTSSFLLQLTEASKASGLKPEEYATQVLEAHIADRRASQRRAVMPDEHYSAQVSDYDAFE